MNVFKSLVLPNGIIIQNRIAKAAMEENLADENHNPSIKLFKLYQSWAQGGVGLILTGNVMIDATAMTGPAGVVLDSDIYLNNFKMWSQISKSHGAKILMQINHPGRQMPKILGQTTIAPSAVALKLGSASNKFAIPRSMTKDQIFAVQKKFVTTAILAQESNFDGVQIHSAHGYLLSQFLSPISNNRDDEWGGSIENRARLLINIVKEIRANVKSDFCVSVKLNSKDFQRGGFSLEDAKQVVKMLNPLGVDLIELSGGNYESPAMQGKAQEKLLASEAYFLELAQEISSVSQVPLMLTGGIKKQETANKVLKNNIAMVGIASQLALNPNLPSDWKNGKNNVKSLIPSKFKNSSYNALIYMSQVRYQLYLLSNNESPNPSIYPLYAFIYDQIQFIIKTIKYRKWIAKKL